MKKSSRKAGRPSDGKQRRHVMLAPEVTDAIVRGAIASNRAFSAEIEFALRQFYRIEQEHAAEAETMRNRDSSQIGQLTRNRGIARNALVVAGTRIPVGAIVRLHEDGYSTEQIIAEYPDLTEEDIEAALTHKPTRAA